MWLSFRKVICAGCSVSMIAYLNRLRIQKAKAMLNRSYLSVESVAEACGVENPSNFTKLFRQTEGITPSAYRNMVNI